MRKGRLVILSLLSLAFWPARPTPAAEPVEAAALAQPPTPPVSLSLDQLSSDPVEISEKREHLTRLYSAIEAEITRLQQQRLELPPDLNVISDLVSSTSQELERNQKKLEAAEKTAVSDPRQIESLGFDVDSSKRSLDRYKSDLERGNRLDAQLIAKRVELENTRNELFKLDRRIASLLNFEENRNEFRKLTSFAFCGLVAVVILGFYLIAFFKSQIAETIFAGEKGIQFITLFLIIIAITLFGIMGILESKELAALLGGLSGYILGRVSS